MTKLLVLLMGLTTAMGAFAQTSSMSQKANSSTMKIEDAKKADEKVKDIDDEITDARMRATLGSKSQWSFKSSLGYSGGSINEPLAAIRPNYRASADIEAMSYLSGDVGVNYRATARDNINFGIGLKINDPLHGDIAKPATDSRRIGRNNSMPRYDMSSPFVSWSRGYRAMEMQNISTLSYYHATDSDSVSKIKQFGMVGFSQTLLANFGSSSWSGGTSFNVYQYIYSGDMTDPGMVAAQAAGAYKRTDQSFGLFPFLQYSFNDTYSFRTVFGYFQFSKYENESKVYQIEPYQSVGVGISITRDVYLYPNVQFTPKDIRGDRTNVALSTNINLF